MISLVIAAVVGVLLVVFLGRAILKAGDDQRRAASQVQTMMANRANILDQQGEFWRRRYTDANNAYSPDLLQTYLSFRTETLRLAKTRVGGDSPRVAAARDGVIAAFAEIDVIVSKALKSPTDRRVLSAVIDESSEPSRRILGYLNEWVGGVIAQGDQAASDARRLSSRLLLWLVVLLACLGLGAVGLWVTLERSRGRLVTALQNSEGRFRSLVQNASDVVMIVDHAGVIVYASEPVQRVFGSAPNEIVGRSLEEIVHPDDRGSLGDLVQQGTGALPTDVPLTWTARHRDGGIRHIETLVSDRRDDPSIAGLVLNSRDVTERAVMQATLTHRAFHDPLTNLANRDLFENRVTTAVDSTHVDTGIVAVIMLDLDDFKTVNDGLGHAAGDALLIAVGQRLSATLRDVDTAARLGGDEFAVLIENAADLGEVESIADRLIDVLRQPISIDGHEIVVQASLGIAVHDNTVTTTAISLVRDADLAMYVAKGRGGNRHELFDPSMSERAAERVNLIGDLHGALERDEFCLHYQPIVDLSDGQVRGVEALIRWDHPTRGLIAPGAFIPTAEETGIIHDIGNWVMRQATAQLAEWAGMSAATDTVSVSINLSARQLERDDVVDSVRDALSTSGLAPHRLTLEITESALMRDPESAIEKLHALHALGVRLAIDDFGTGYSSLSYLANLPIDLVKIDRSFVDGMRHGRRDARLTSMIIGIGESLNITTVAEGVETEGQVDDLRALGCQMAQGFHFARPLPSHQIVTLIDAGVDLTSREAVRRGTSHRPGNLAFGGSSTQAVATPDARPQSMSHPAPVAIDRDPAT